MALVTGQGQFSFTSNTLNWTAVPEPTSALAGLLITAGLLRRRRRKEILNGREQASHSCAWFIALFLENFKLEH